MSSFEQLLKNNNLDKQSTALFLCDMQEKFRPAIFKFDEIIQTCSRLVRKLKRLQKKLKMQNLKGKSIKNPWTEYRGNRTGNHKILNWIFRNNPLKSKLVS